MNEKQKIILCYMVSLFFLAVMTSFVSGQQILYQNDFHGNDGDPAVGWDVPISTAFIDNNTLYVTRGSLESGARMMLYEGDNAETPIMFSSDIKVTYDFYTDRDSFGKTTWVGGLILGYDDDGSYFGVAVYRGRELIISNSSYDWSYHIARIGESDPEDYFVVKQWYTMEVEYQLDELTGTTSILASVYNRDTGELYLTLFKDGLALRVGQLGLSNADAHIRYENLMVTTIPEFNFSSLVLGSLLFSLLYFNRRRFMNS